MSHMAPGPVRTVIEFTDISGLPCLLDPDRAPGVQLNLGCVAGLQASITLTDEQADWLIGQLQQALHHARTQAPAQTQEDEPA